MLAYQVSNAKYFTGKTKMGKRIWLTVVGLCWALAAGEARGQEPLAPPAVAPKPPARELPQLKPPGAERVFRLESQEVLYQRIRKEAKEGPSGYDAVLPEEPPLPKELYAGRHWDSMTETIAPAFLCYGRLRFEQINSERYGWDLGVAHPFLSAGIFYFDVATLPYRLGTEPFRLCECNTGYFLPGDPVPLLLYPPELSGTGALAEAAFIGTLFAIFP